MDLKFNRSSSRETRSEANVKILKRNELQIDGELVLKKKKIHVPKDKQLRVGIIQLHYDILIAKYKGTWNITKLAMWNYWWPEVTKDIENYVNGCNLYQWIKNRTEVSAEKLMVNEVPEKT